MIARGLIRFSAIYDFCRNVSVTYSSWLPFGSWFAVQTSIRLGPGCVAEIVLLIRVVGPLLFILRTVGLETHCQFGTWRYFLYWVVWYIVGRIFELRYDSAI